MADDTLTVQGPLGWRLLLPAGWASLPTDASHRDAAIKRLLDRQFRKAARDELIHVRIDIEQRLRRDVARAAESGVTQIHALVEPIEGLPVAATLLVAQIFIGGEAQVDADLQRLLGEGTGVIENGMVEFGDMSALRRRRRAEEPIDDAPGAPVVWHTHLDYVLQADADRMLVLSFVTSTDPVADQLVFLFDSIAATLHTDPDDRPAWFVQRYGEDSA